jgi:hypothetical protein
MPYVLRPPLINLLHCSCKDAKELGFRTMWDMGGNTYNRFEYVPLDIVQAHCSNNLVISHILRPKLSSAKFAAFGEQIQLGSKPSSRLVLVKKHTAAAPVRAARELI